MTSFLMWKQEGSRHWGTGRIVNILLIGLYEMDSS